MRDGEVADDYSKTNKQRKITYKVLNGLNSRVCSFIIVYVTFIEAIVPHSILQVFSNLITLLKDMTCSTSYTHYINTMCIAH